MNKNVFECTASKDLVADPLSEIIRDGARRLLESALKVEVELFLERYSTLLDEAGRRRLVRNGYHGERSVQTGVGSVTVQVPRTRDRARSSDRITFRSSILPPYLRRSRSIEALLPWLYLKGISTGAMQDALAALVGEDAPGLSSTTITRLKAVWQDEYRAWKQRSLLGKRYVYFWVDGVNMQVRMDQEKQTLLVIIAATEEGKKELLAVEDGYRESTQSWVDLLLDLKRRGLQTAPECATGDGALGFWNALHQVYPTTKQQRCWVHKTANILNRLPKSLQSRADEDLKQIWMAASRKDADKAFDTFLERYGPKYPKVKESMENDREELLTFYAFPAEHWVHLRTTNPIESTFATVRLRTAKTRGCLSRETALTMAFRLCQEAEKKWRCLNGRHHITKLIAGITYIDGLATDRIAA